MRYSIGIDVGLYSVGFAAIQLDDDDMPIKLLNAMSLIHDSGLDPDSQKEAKTRKAVSGVARRTRRMYAARKKRLIKLDEFLQSRGYPIIDVEKEPEKAAWKARAQLAAAVIDDEDLRRKMLSIAVRHIARHRGWRNPYIPAERLRSLRAPSPAFTAITEKAHELGVGELPGEPTLSEIVMALPKATVRLRGEGGLLSERLNQQDFANEILKISSVQGLDTKFTDELISHVFAAKSPKGAAEKFVGKDELDPTQYRAWRATLAFNEYRIISLLANVRVLDTSENRIGVERPLTVAERQKVFAYLNEWTKLASPTWEDIATLLEVDRGALKGTATSNDDGERVTSAPPTNLTNQVFWNCKVKSLREFWRKGSPAMRIALVNEFSNVEGNAEDSPEAIAAANVMRALPPEELEKVESIKLPSGRAAYSQRTLKRLRDYMLNNEADLHAARKAVFDVDDDWRPTPSPIEEQTGNPAVDRTLKGINRWIRMAQQRWGSPVSINVETARDGFKSESLAREIEREIDRRRKKNLASLALMTEALGIEGHPRQNDLIRYQAVQRQNGQCAYCGTMITFKNAELDHIVPRAGVGSTNQRVNLLACCHDCNLSKGKVPFAAWARSPKARPNVSLDGAIERVYQWSEDPGLRTRDMNNFRHQVIQRLKRTTQDEEIDARSKESVAWMAVELQQRLHGFYDVQSDPAPKIGVFNGRVTALARKAAGIEKQIEMIGGRRGKDRLDRRHHAVDATVIALMKPRVAQTLIERDNLRNQEYLLRRPDAIYGTWKEFTGRTVENRAAFLKWEKRMEALVPLVQQALDEDRIPVTQNLRLRLGNGQAHEAGIHALVHAQVTDALPISLIDRAASPALWCALTRQPDFDWKDGLPENPYREIVVNGTHLSGTDNLDFFAVKAGAIAVRHGYAELGASFHHARLYRIPVGKKTAYCMMRVYTVDLLKHRHEDLFSVELAPQTMTVRQCEPKLRKALREGTAEYITWFVVGDELHLDAKKVATGQAATFLEEYGDVRSWRVRGFYSETRLRIKPNSFASEGMPDDINSDCKKVIDAPGWLPAVNKVFGLGGVTIVRRDAHGRPRLHSQQGLPITIKVV